jgi:predicted nucleic acid-binding protein
MITAIDSSVILDVLTEDTRFADISEEHLRKAAQEGKLIVCECVVAEIYPAIADKERFKDLLADWQLEFVPSTHQSACLAGENFGKYLKRGGKAKRIIADFLIGAHAIFHADRLLARDRGYLRDYFRGLDVWYTVQKNRRRALAK